MIQLSAEVMTCAWRCTNRNYVVESTLIITACAVRTTNTFISFTFSHSLYIRLHYGRVCPLSHLGEKWNQILCLPYFLILTWLDSLNNAVVPSVSSDEVLRNRMME